MQQVQDPSVCLPYDKKLTLGEYINKSTLYQKKSRQFNDLTMSYAVIRLLDFSEDSGWYLQTSTIFNEVQ
jgi:hypothetical protein